MPAKLTHLACRIASAMLKLERAAAEAGFTFKAHPHMLQHACGYKLANDGKDTRSLQAYLGHRNIQHTVRHSYRRPGLKVFWRSASTNALRAVETA
jgi:site-specific recombinase XerD